MEVVTPASLGGAILVISKFTDDVARWNKKSTFIKKKDIAVEILCDYVKDSALNRIRVQVMRSDKFGGHTAGFYRKLCRETGTRQEFAASYSPQQTEFLSGIEERWQK